jgi:type IX secretion system protein PorV
LHTNIKFLAMRSTAIKFIAANLFFFPFIFNCQAQQSTNISNVVTTAVPFLRISPDARSAGMGDLGVAMSPDPFTIFWNNAKTPFNESKGGIGATYTPWLRDLGLNDVFLASLSGYYKFDDQQAIAGSVRYFSLGDIQFTDNLGNDLNIFRPKEFGIDLGYSRKLSEKMGVGVTLKYIYSNLAGNFSSGGSAYKPGTSVAGDISWYYDGKNEVGSGWAFGVNVSNLGSKIAYTDNADQKDFIPANLALGTSYTKVIDDQNKVSFGLDINKLMVPTPPAEGDSNGLAKYRSQSVPSSWFTSFSDAPGGAKEELQEYQLSVGGEYWYNNQFGFRAGYFYENKYKGNRSAFNMGVSVKYNIFTVHFSYLFPSGSGVNRNPLSNTLRFTLLFDLSGGGNDNTTESK